MEDEIDVKDKVLDNLRRIEAISETLSNLSENHDLSVKSINTIGYMLNEMSYSSIELLNK